MAEQAMQQEFEEPDGLPVPDVDAGDDELEIEVLDDTPEEDRRPNRSEVGDRLDPDSDEFQAEVDNYSEKAQERIKALKYEFHEERRAKEAALREREEATNFAQQVARDNAALKQTLENSNSVLLEQLGARSDAELEKARADFKSAYEDGRTDDLLSAQERISALTAEKISRANVRPQPQPAPQAQHSPVNSNVPDARTAKWLQENTWFQAPGREDMTGYAVGLHEKLIKQGYDPRIHEEYFTKIDEGMRAVFPTEFSEGNKGGNGAGSPVATSEKKPPKVGGPSRGGKPPRKVQLTATQVALAKRLGLTNKQYAAQVVKETMQDG